MATDIDLRMARREAERAMRDRCTVTRERKSDVFDEETGTYPVVQDVVYGEAGKGRARLKNPRTVARPHESASHLTVSTQLEIQVPVDSEDFEPGDILEMTACPDRPRQVGRKFRVIGPFDGTQTTALRYRVEVHDAR